MHSYIDLYLPLSPLQVQFQSIPFPPTDSQLTKNQPQSSPPQPSLPRPGGGDSTDGRESSTMSPPVADMYPLQVWSGQLVLHVSWRECGGWAHCVCCIHELRICTYVCEYIDKKLKHFVCSAGR